MSHLRILMGARLTALRNRTRGRDARWWAGLLGAIGALIAGLVALGHAAAPGLLEPPADVVTAVGMANDAGELPIGAAALEAAFWLAALASSVLNFRVMELLFRRKDVQAVEPYPVKLYALFVDRLLASLGEAVAASLVIAPFFVPMIWHGGALAAATSIALVAVGLVTSSAIGFAIQIGAGSTMGRKTPSGSKKSKKKDKSRNLYGGSAQVFLYAPGVALAVSVVLILLAKLAFGEVLKAGEATRAFGFGLAILGVAFSISVISSFRRFVASFPRMAARFHEADFVGYKVSAKHQTSGFGSPRLGEKLLPKAARPVFRAYALQFGRRYLLARWTYGLGWLAAAIAVFRLSEAALPGWLIATLPAIAAATLANPWGRLSDQRIRPAYQNLLALPQNADLMAAVVFAVRECLLVTAPYALLVLIAQGVRYGDWVGGLGLAALAICACLAINGAMAVAWRVFGRSRLVEVSVPMVCAIGMVALANVSLWALAVFEVVLLCGHFGVLGGSRLRVGVEP
jgi:hypothetical protein